MNSFIPWIGGKRALRKQIIAEFPENGTYARYIEVFGGAGWVLFAEDKHASMEIFNDVNGELINLFRIVKYHPEALQQELEWLLTSREQFFDEMGKNPKGMTDIQRAARYFAILKESFGADCKSFVLRSRDMEMAKIYLSEVSKRLNKVIIEHESYERIIKTYDRPDALLYLDPPYYEAEKYYPDRFNPEDHEQLCEILGHIAGKFVLSYNDCEVVRRLYEGYNIIPVERSDNLTTKSGGKKYKELIIKNFS